MGVITPRSFPQTLVLPQPSPPTCVRVSGQRGASPLLRSPPRLYNGLPVGLVLVLAAHPLLANPARLWLAPLQSKQNPLCPQLRFLSLSFFFLAPAVGARLEQLTLLLRSQPAVFLLTSPPLSPLQADLFFRPALLPLSAFLFSPSFFFGSHFLLTFFPGALPTPPFMLEQ